MLRYQKIDVSEGIDENKLVHQNNVRFPGFLKILHLNLKNTFVINVVIKFDDYSISPKIRQILLHFTEKDFLMS